MKRIDDPYRGILHFLIGNTPILFCLAHPIELGKKEKGIRTSEDELMILRSMLERSLH